MVLERLIRCYYEKNGSFDGIDKTFFYDRMKEANLTDLNKLYEVLGFTSLNDSSPYDVYIDNKRYLRGEIEATENVYSGMDRLKLTELNGIAYPFLVTLLSAYFRYSRNNFVPVSTDESVPFSNILSSLSMLTTQAEISQAIKHPAIQYGIKNFTPKWSKAEVDCAYIANGVLYHNEDLTVKEKNQIVKDAIMDSLYNTLLVPLSTRLEVISLLTTNLINLAKTKPNSYRTIILIASSLGLTVKALCEACNISWIDTMEQVETTNCSITSFTDTSVKIFSIDSTAEDFVVVNNDDFKSLYERNILPTLEFENQIAYVTISNKISLYNLLMLNPSRDLRR